MGVEVDLGLRTSNAVVVFVDFFVCILQVSRAAQAQASAGHTTDRQFT